MGSVVLHLRKLTSLILLALILASCESGIVHEEVNRIESASWAIDDIKEFIWEVADSTLSYDIYIVLQHNERYAYRNLFLFTDYELSGSAVVQDTLAAFLANKDGRWTGKGSGALLSHRFPYLMNQRFDRTGALSVSIQHGMRDLELEGIEQIGLLIKEHASEE